MTTITIATDRDREAIYAMRHQVYAEELGQHFVHPDRRLRDRLDEINTYLIAKKGSDLIGFISITPPGPQGYSIDKYFSREAVPVTFDAGLFEVRLLTVAPSYRRTQLAMVLMHAALRYLESRGARTIVAIGRLEVAPFYERAGLRRLGPSTIAGAVGYDLMGADIATLRARVSRIERLLARSEGTVDWQVDGVPLRPPAPCFHGGSFFTAIGDEFTTLDHADRVINADVLDAWFDPAPSVVDVLTRHLRFALKTSPPTHADGMRRVIARSRGVPEVSVLPGAGSSDLIFAAIQRWISHKSRVLILDPMYGEYAHVLEHVVGATIERFPLSKADGYTIDSEALFQAMAACDWVFIVNPNSPTGRHMTRAELEHLIQRAPRSTKFWIDETYVDYVGEDQSLEKFAARSSNAIVCKSMSKVYALSGVRAAYLCGPVHWIEDLKVSCPPWSVSLPAQMAACEALKAIAYYRERWTETHVLREELAFGLCELGWRVTPGCANFLLCHLPAVGPDAVTTIALAKQHALFLRDVSSMGTRFDAYTLRIAVKDRVTNQRILRTLSLLTKDSRRPSASVIVGSDEAKHRRTQLSPPAPNPAPGASASPVSFNSFSVNAVESRAASSWKNA